MAEWRVLFFARTLVLTVERTETLRTPSNTARRAPTKSRAWSMPSGKILTFHVSSLIAVEWHDSVLVKLGVVDLCREVGNISSCWRNGNSNKLSETELNWSCFSEDQHRGTVHPKLHWLPSHRLLQCWTPFIEFARTDAREETIHPETVVLFVVNKVDQFVN